MWNAAPVFWRMSCCSSTAVILDWNASPIIRSLAVFHLARPARPREVPEGGHAALLEAFNPHGDPARALHQRICRMLNAFVAHAHHVYRSHSDLDPRSFSFLYALFRSSGLAVAMPCVVQGDQNLFLFDRLVPQGLLRLAVGMLI